MKNWYRSHAEDTMPLAIRVLRSGLILRSSNTPLLTASERVCTPGGIQREPKAEIRIAGTSGIDRARNVRAWPMWSMRKPARSGPAKLAEARPRLRRLKLRARSAGAAVETDS